MSRAWADHLIIPIKEASEMLESDLVADPTAISGVRREPVI